MKIRRVVVLDLFTYKKFLISMLMVFLPSSSFAQQSQTETITHLTPPSIADLPLIMDTATAGPIRVDLVTDGLSHPYGMVFLPNGDMLITERAGRVRILRDGILLPDPVPGAPDIRARRLSGLQDIALHPNFSENQLVYLSYSKPGVDEPDAEAEEPTRPSLTLARGRFDGTAFHDMHEIFSAGPAANGGSRLLFAPDGSLFMSAGGAFTVPISAHRAQDLNDHIGKLLRLNDDGSAHPDNPFTGALDTKPEIYSLGHRNQQGLAINP
ncbi:MAG: PQQ-dependent sugar dehydrogenase, partial [Gammaproteobacteria bacterium]|nr:PQQ-dependent sugar dehydrogenase [Gammaproteobacteria bacterium]